MCWKNWFCFGWSDGHPMNAVIAIFDSHPARIPWGPRKSQRNLALSAALIRNIDKLQSVPMEPAQDSHRNYQTHIR